MSVNLYYRPEKDDLVIETSTPINKSHWALFSKYNYHVRGGAPTDLPLDEVNEELIGLL